MVVCGKVCWLLRQNSSTYWEGKTDAEQLQRIYGISFPDTKQLKEWQKIQEEAAKRDHRKIGRVWFTVFLIISSYRYVCVVLHVAACDLLLYSQQFGGTDCMQCFVTLAGSGVVLLSWIESRQLLLSAKRCTHLQHTLWSSTGKYFVSRFLVISSFYVTRVLNLLHSPQCDTFTMTCVLIIAGYNLTFDKACKKLNYD